MPILKAVGITKEFPGVKALRNVNFEVEAGEVHGLIGENGAGKSTLVKILTGVYKQDSGQILLNGENVNIDNPHIAFEYGISVIHQELNLLRDLNVTTNVLLGGYFPKKGPFIDWKKANNEVQSYVNLVDDSISSKSIIRNMSISKAQLIEISKSFSRNAKIVFMDEPTSSLSNTEQEKLFKVIEEMKKKGVAVIYISHRLEEIMNICDRITVLRDGQYIDTLKVEDTNIDHLVSLMVGREVEDRYPKVYNQIGEKMLEVKNLNIHNTLHNISFNVRKGEILGLYGLVGAGRTELARAIFGVDKIDSGEIFINSKKVKVNSVADAVDNGIALLTEDRKYQGLQMEMSVEENITIPCINCNSVKKDYFKGIFINRKATKRNTQEYIDLLKIRTPSINQKVKFLSGGNQQKVVLAKWLSTNPKIIIFDEPTRGIDVGTKVDIYLLMQQLAKEGAAIVMISSELPEVMGISDRIIVMREGNIVAEFNRDEATEEKIGRCCSLEVNA
jgi:ribose transport system ATP-binding protein